LRRPLSVPPRSFQIGSPSVPEGRQNLAHGVSHGTRRTPKPIQAPSGAAEPFADLKENPTGIPSFSPGWPIWRTTLGHLSKELFVPFRVFRGQIPAQTRNQKLETGSANALPSPA